jgi:hypothetical protein
MITGTNGENIMKRFPVIAALAALMLIGDQGIRAQEAKRKFVPVTDACSRIPIPRTGSCGAAHWIAGATAR